MWRAGDGVWSTGQELHHGAWGAIAAGDEETR